VFFWRAGKRHCNWQTRWYFPAGCLKGSVLDKASRTGSRQLGKAGCPAYDAYLKGNDMAYKKRRYSRAAPKGRKKSGYGKRTYKAKRRATPRGQRITIVLQQAPTGMMPGGLTLGKKNYTPVRATL